MSKSLAELKKVVMEDIKVQESYIKSFEGHQNPQVQTMYEHALARKEALEAVLLYTQNGSKLYFTKLED